MKNKLSSGSVVNFGCRLNSYESNVIKNILSKHDKNNELIVINSCSVTNNAESEVIKSIKKIKEQYPSKKIVLTGCASQSNPEKYDQLKDVDYIIGNSLKLNETPYKNIIQNLPIEHGLTPSTTNKTSTKRHQDELYKKEIGGKIELKNTKSIVSNIMEERDAGFKFYEHFEGKTRAFLQIQNGCNHRCTFCIIPFGRGNSRSAPIGDIVKQINILTSKGYTEVVFTGVDITDYGLDLPNKTTLGKMIKRVLQNCPDLKRLRLSSVDVSEIDDDIFDLLANEERFMPYFHLSLQSGNNTILKRMARRHTREQIIDFCNKARSIRPETCFGSDIITGFPTETEEMFQDSVSIIQECRIIFNHIFTFSPKKGTPAAKMPQIDQQIKKLRTTKLIQTGKTEMDKYLNSIIGQTFEVLVEGEGYARCKNFLQVKLNNPNQSLIGTIQMAKINEVQNSIPISHIHQTS